MNEGIPIIQEYLTNNIHIENMNGFHIPEINYNINYTDINNKNIFDFNYTNYNNIIQPIINNNYDTITYPNLDLIFKSDQYIINNLNYNFYKNGIPHLWLLF